MQALRAYAYVYAALETGYYVNLSEHLCYVGIFRLLKLQETLLLHSTVGAIRRNCNIILVYPHEK